MYHYIDARNDSRKIVDTVAGGIIPENVLRYAHRKGLLVFYFVDNDIQKLSIQYLGIPVHSPSMFYEEDKVDLVILVSMRLFFCYEVIAQLLRMGFERIKIKKIEKAFKQLDIAGIFEISGNCPAIYVYE